MDTRAVKLERYAILFTYVMGSDKRKYNSKRTKAAVKTKGAKQETISRK
jgi:hypothetical protein